MRSVPSDYRRQLDRCGLSALFTGGDTRMSGRLAVALLVLTVSVCSSSGVPGLPCISSGSQWALP